MGSAFLKRKVKCLVRNKKYKIRLGKRVAFIYYEK